MHPTRIAAPLPLHLWSLCSFADMGSSGPRPDFATIWPDERATFYCILLPVELTDFGQVGLLKRCATPNTWASVCAATRTDRTQRSQTAQFCSLTSIALAFAKCLSEFGPHCRSSPDVKGANKLVLLPSAACAACCASCELECQQSGEPRLAKSLDVAGHRGFWASVRSKPETQVIYFGRMSRKSCW